MRFEVKVSKNQWVIKKQDINIEFYIKNLNNWKYIIFLKYISTKSNIILNILFLIEKQYSKKYFNKNNFEDNLYLVVMEFDYFIDKIKI